VLRKGGNSKKEKKILSTRAVKRFVRIRKKNDLKKKKKTSRLVRKRKDVSSKSGKGGGGAVPRKLKGKERIRGREKRFCAGNGEKHSIATFKKKGRIASEGKKKKKSEERKSNCARR